MRPPRRHARDLETGAPVCQFVPPKLFRRNTEMGPDSCGPAPRGGPGSGCPRARSAEADPRWQISGLPGVDHRNGWIVEMSEVSRCECCFPRERNAGDLNIAEIDLPPSLPIRGS